MPPKNGKKALLSAASPWLMPSDSLKYVGIQVLNVSRSSVSPSESMQTHQKTLRRKSGASRAHTPAGTGSLPCSPNRLSGCDAGSGSPICRRALLRKTMLITSSTNIVPAQAKKTCCQVQPASSSNP